VARKKISLNALRRQLLETHWDEIEKMAMGLQSGNSKPSRCTAWR